MKSLFLGILSGLLVLQGCGDSEDKTTTTTTTTTSPPTTAVSTTSSKASDSTCMYHSPNGFVHLEAEKREHGFYLKSSSCEYYPTFEKFRDSKLADTPESLNLLIVQLIFAQQATVDRNGTAFGIKDILEELFASTFANISASINNTIENTPEGSVDTLEIAGNAFGTLQEDLPSLTKALFDALFQDKIMNITFENCQQAINTASSVFGVHSSDTLCDPNRPSLSTETCTLTGNRGTVVLDRQEGWVLTGLTCDGEENAAAEEIMIKKVAMFPAGNIFGDAALHYMSCEELQKYRKWANEADAACFINMPSCSNSSDGGHFEVSLDWDSQYAAELVELEKWGDNDMNEHDLKHSLSAELESIFGLEQPKLHEMAHDEKAHAAYTLKSLTCPSYPTLKEEFMKYIEMAHLGDVVVRFSSCDQAESDVMEALGGWDLATFCGEPANATITEADTSCVLASPNGMLEVGLMWNATTTAWEVSPFAMCKEKESLSATVAAADYISERTDHGEAFAAAFNRMSCDMIKANVASHILYPAAIGCFSELQLGSESKDGHEAGSVSGNKTGNTTRMLGEANELPSSRILEMHVDAAGPALLM